MKEPIAYSSSVSNNGIPYVAWQNHNLDLVGGGLYV
jgi:hypothetical protein